LVAEFRNVAIADIDDISSGFNLADIDDISSGFNFNGDSLEAEAFAFLAIRALKELPISFPLTTGVSRPTVGGTVFNAVL
jgi:1,6-anhydro-N-acetylmuramate kinase